MNDPQLQATVLIVVIPLMISYAIPLLGWRWRESGYYVAQSAIGASLVCALILLHGVLTQGTIHYHLGGWFPPWGIEYVIDPLNGFIAVVVCATGFLVTLFSKESVEKELPDKKTRFYTIYLLLFTGLMGIVVTGDLFNLFVFLEIASLAAYALIAIGKDDAPLASFNYIIMGTIGAIFYLLGVGYLYIITGSLNIADLSKLLPPLYESKVVLIAMAFFAIGLAIKIGLFPLHGWLPDAYTYAPSPVSSFIAPLMTKVGCYVMIRIIFTVFKPYFSIESIPVTEILSWIAAAGMIMGSIFAIAQSDFKKMLSFSIVAQTGYIVLGIGLANRTALTGSLLHILNEALTIGVLFSVAGAIVYKLGTSNIYQFGNLHKKMPFTMAAFLVGAFSMVGTPPTCGFFSKLYLILGAIEAKQWVFVAVILVSTLLNVIYFFKVVEIVYFKPRELATEKEKEILKVVYANGGSYKENTRELDLLGRNEAPLSMLIPIFIMAAGIVLAGIFYFDIITGVIQHAIPSGI
ncbi:MAG: monovalent cation/H+ antiporter subunit D family protein [Deltaproteobacteria bacterium]|nr:monovalent cation/H+ antiporter subunit D family protein [Deltaproteobacteria bacterium]